MMNEYHKMIQFNIMWKRLRG